VPERAAEPLFNTVDDDEARDAIRDAALGNVWATTCDDAILDWRQFLIDLRAAGYDIARKPSDG
jgi:hypothetical protein